jgi:hypothetical protein
MKLIGTGSLKARWRRRGATIATLAATTMLFGSVQALGPSSAAAMPKACKPALLKALEAKTEDDEKYYLDRFHECVEEYEPEREPVGTWG